MNMLRLRFFTDCTARTKNGQAAQIFRPAVAIGAAREVIVAMARPPDAAVPGTQ